jgi:2-polyprenyl-3-methyl-5-hydroxy-6-metoxy-1,4-benzoquinol methylase
VSGGPQELADAIWEALPEAAAPERLALRRAFLLARVHPGERVLDVGCGAGELSAALREAGTDVVAVDVAAEALRRARTRVPGLDARHWPAGTPLPVEDASVDVAWAGEVLEHVVDLAPWLSEVRRTLRPRGRLLVSTPHTGRGRLLVLAASARRFAEHFEPRADHVRFFSPATLRALLDDLGFEVHELRTAGGPPGLRSTILASATRP